MSNESFLFKPATSYEGLSPITQAYAVCLDDKGNVILQKCLDRPWNIPGGRPEPGETYEQTAIREVYEEVTVVVERPTLIGYQEYWKDGALQSYQLRYVAFITRVDPPAIDPDNGILRDRIFVPLDEAMNYVPYPQYAEMFNEAKKFLKG